MILVLLWRLCFSEAGLYVWGSNYFGQLGTGKIGGCITRPTLCEVSLTFDVVMEMLCLSLFGIQGGHGNPGKKKRFWVLCHSWWKKREKKLTGCNFGCR